MTASQPGVQRPRSKTLRVWKFGSITGLGMVAVGIGAGYVDIGTSFAFPFLDHYFPDFLLCLFIGLLLAFICLIGWATHLRKAAKTRLAAMVFCSPWLVVVVGYPIAGTNIHGPGGLVMYLVAPVLVLLSVVLLIMAAVQADRG